MGRKKKLILPCYLKPISSILVLVNKIVDINSWKRFSQIFCYDVSSWEKSQPLKLGVGKKYQTEQKKKNRTIINNFENKLKQFGSWLTVWFGSNFFSEKLAMVWLKTIKLNYFNNSV
jgi:hypothetical protein